MASFRSIIGLSPSTASTSDSVLVIIDAQNEYANGQLRISGIEESRKIIASLLEKYRVASAPAIHVVHKVPDGAPVFTPGTALAEEFAELKPTNGEHLITKQFPGAFNGTNLQSLLEATGRTKIVLTGYMVRHLLLFFSFSLLLELFSLIIL
jgi:nicotinamidase-related amidase